MRVLLHRLINRRVKLQPGWPKDYRTQSQIDRDWELIYRARVARNVAERQARAVFEPDYIPEHLRLPVPSILQRQAA